MDQTLRARKLGSYSQLYCLEKGSQGEIFLKVEEGSNSLPRGEESCSALRKDGILVM